MSLKNAKIVTVSTDNRAYISDNGIKRGDPAFVMSRSALKDFSECPARWVNGYKMEGNAQTEWGTLMDILVTDQEHFDQRISVCPATYPGKDRKGNPVDKPWTFQADYCDEWRQSQGDRVIVKSEHYSRAEEALNVLLKDDECKAIIQRSRRQVLIMAEYEDFGSGMTIPLKCLIDLVPDKPFQKCLVDYKTATSGNPHAFARTAFDFGYHMQAAMYLDLWNAATGENRNEFRHIVQESYPPYQITKALMSEEFITLGRQAYDSALQKYCVCLSSGVWPGYASNTVLDGWNITEPQAWMVTA